MSKEKPKFPPVIVKNIAELTPYARNPRKNEPTVAAVKASIQEFGFLVPIVIDAQGVIAAGHTRVLAAKELGFDTLPCVDASHLTEQQAKAFRILDNKIPEKSAWDGELLGLELEDLADFNFEPFEVDFDLDLPTSEVNTEEDEVPEAPEKPFTQLGDLWLCGEHRVLCGDALQQDCAESLCGSQQPTLFITDPPYGVSYADKNAFLNTIGRGNRIQKPISNDHQTPNEMKDFWLTAFEVAHAITADNASYYLFGPQGGDLMMMMMSIKDAKWQLKHMLVWVKNNHVLGRADYNYKHEPIWFGWKDGESHKFFGSASEVSVWEADKPLSSKLHPTMKPIELIVKALQNSTRAGEHCYDPFLGSGTTLIAAERCGRICYGIELEPRYVDVICRRYYNETGIVPVRESDGAEFPI